jgi:hypothetical protein
MTIEQYREALAKLGIELTVDNLRVLQDVHLHGFEKGLDALAKHWDEDIKKRSAA